MKIKWLKQISDLRGEEPKDWVEMGNYYLTNFSPKVNDLSMLLLNDYHRREAQNIPHLYIDMVKTCQDLNLPRKNIISLKTFLSLYIWYNKDFVTTTGQDIDLMLLGIYRIIDVWDQRNQSPLSIGDFSLKFCLRISRQDKRQRILNRYSELRYKIIQAMHNKVNVEREVMLESPSKLEDYFILDKNSLKPKNLYLRMRLSRFRVDYRIRKNIGYIYSDQFFQSFYKVMLRSEVENKTKQLLWQLSWEGIMVGKITKQWFEEENGICKICHSAEETIEHLFKDCVMVNEFLKWLYNKIEVNFENDGLSVYLNDFQRTNDAQFLCLAYSKRVVWNIRNKCVFDAFDPSLYALKKMYKNTLSKVLHILYISKEGYFRENLMSRLNGIEILNEKIVINW